MNREVFGIQPMARSTPSHSRLHSSSVSMFFSLTPSTRLSPKMSWTMVFQRKLILSFSSALCFMHMQAVNLSRRWMTTTSVANFARSMASWTAESPPPTTTTFLHS